MIAVATNRTGYAVLAEPFMAIPQAVGIDVERKLGAGFLAAFVRDKKAEGFVRQSLDRSGHFDVVVPA